MIRRAASAAATFAGAALLAGCITLVYDDPAAPDPSPGASASASQAAPRRAEPYAEAAIRNGLGASIGRASFREGPEGVVIRIELTPGALTPGWHGMHLHQVGTCADNLEGFMASSSHVGHGGGAVHGLLNPQGPEAGDLPNIYAPAEGPILAEVYSPFITLSTSSPLNPFGAQARRTQILDADGSALVFHAAADDHVSQPIGGAGARVACGVVAAG